MSLTGLTEYDVQQRFCIFCITKRDRVTGELIPAVHRLCVGRWSDRWCECLECCDDWLQPERTPAP